LGVRRLVGAFTGRGFARPDTNQSTSGAERRGQSADKAAHSKELNDLKTRSLVPKPGNWLPRPNQSRLCQSMTANKHARGVLAATILASSMAFIDGTVVNVALPALQKELDATAIGVQWVVEAYSLFLAALLLVGGSLGDHYGRKRIFLIGISLFALASAWCGLAPNIEQLIVARAVQGIGGALLIPGSLAIISASFPPKQRGRAIGTWSGFSAITTAIGPVLGGWLIENVSWRAVFFLNLPLAVAVIVITLRSISESRDRKHTGAIDWLGATLATLGLGGVTFGLIESSRLGYLNTPVLATIGGGLVILAVFVLVEARIKSPMLPLELFRSRNFSGANLLTLLLYFSLSAGFFFLSLNLIQVQEFSATAAGAALLPFVILMFALSRWSGGLVDRFGPRPPLVIGPVVASVGFLIMALQTAQAGYWTGFFPGVIVLGVGMAITVAPLTTTVMSSVAESQAGVASGINNAVSRAAGLLAIAVLGVVMLQVFSRELQRQLMTIDLPQSTRDAVYNQRIKLAGLDVEEVVSRDDNSKRAVTQAMKESFVAGFRMVMLISAAMALGGAVASWLLIESKRKAAT
ncbi:MAG TPA: MFS transporter, partial [Pyrinomonadaceae bacterium]|nr:MFS transporter [Pyrinomonadaceae bacterium]